MNKIADLKDKKEIKRIQMAEQLRSKRMQASACERELDVAGGNGSSSHKESREARRVKASIEQAKKVSYNVYEYTTFSSHIFKGYGK